MIHAVMQEQEQKQKQRLQTCHEKTQDKWQGKKKARGKAEARQRDVRKWIKWFIKVIKKCHVRQINRNGYGRSWISNIRLWNYYILTKSPEKNFWILFSLTYLFICVFVKHCHFLNRYGGTILLQNSSFWLIFLISTSIYSLLIDWHSKEKSYSQTI